MNTLTDFFLPFSLWFQNLGAWLIPPMQVATFLGNELFYLLIMPALYWCVQPGLGIEIGIMLLISGGFNSLLKSAIRSPRPFWVSGEIQKLASGTNFGFPSGHAQNAASLWGLAAARTRRSGLRFGLVLVIVLIGTSRIVLGVHFLHDVLAGWLAGAFLLALYLKYKDHFLEWFQRYSTSSQILLILIGSLLLIAAGLILHWLHVDDLLPPEWLVRMENPADTAGLESLFTIGGVLFGLASGIILLPFAPALLGRGSNLKKTIRYPLGLVGVLVFYAGLGTLFPEGNTPIALALRYFRYSLIGFWISWGAPRLFDLLGLLEDRTGGAD